MRTRTNVILAMLLTCMLLLAGCGTENNAQAAGPENGQQGDGLLSKLMPGHEDVVVPIGTAVTIRLQNSISSASAASGDVFDFVLAEPLVIDGKTIAEQGTPGQGRVVTVRRSGRLHNSGFLRIRLESLEMSGSPVTMRTSTVFISGGRYRNRNMAWIGGGAGAGALIGGIAGGGKGALIGGLIGAGSGTAGAYATGKKDVGFSAERVLTFKLMQPLKIKE